MREMIVFLRVIIMWYVSGLSCRKSGSCHSHIDGCDCYVPTGITFSFLHPFMCIYAMNWMNFWFLISLFCFSLVLFDGLIIPSLVCFVNTFLNFSLIFLSFFVLCVYILLFIYIFIIFCKFFFISLQTVFCGL